MVKFIVASHWLIFLLRHNQSDTITVFLVNTSRFLNELRHLYQYKKNKFYHGIKKTRKYNMGTRAKLCEVDASLYAKRKVREYRKGNFKLSIV